MRVVQFFGIEPRRDTSDYILKAKDDLK